MSGRMSPFVCLIIVAILSTVQAERVGSCICNDGLCNSLTLIAADFLTADKMCQENIGELMTVRRKASDNVIEHLLLGLNGDFWIGLRLPDERCSNITTKLRGYEWTTGAQITHFSNWKDNVNVCSPLCVSVSNDRKWTERPCQDITHGFFCGNIPKSSCQTPHMEAQEFSHQMSVIKSDEGCSRAPCEHTCTEVSGGYACSCYKGFRPSSKDPHLCKMYCSSQECPAMCDPITEGCNCPDGYIRDGDRLCRDINECESRTYCDQVCDNSFGSYICSCGAGYFLGPNGHDCVKQDEHERSTTPAISDFLTPSLNTSKVSDPTTGRLGLLWLWIIPVVALVGLLIFVFRYCFIKHCKKTVNGVDNTVC